MAAITLPFTLPQTLGSADDGNSPVTTVYREDFVGRNLANPAPGASHATDYLGRNVGTGDKDFMGRGLTSKPHAVSTAYAKGTVVYFPSGAEMTAITSGTSAGTAPNPPAIGATVVDGDVIWLRTE